MDRLEKRFQEGGGPYQQLDFSQENKGGGGKLSPRSENWKQKYLEMKLERDNLKKENSTLKKRIQKLVKD
tara:strand:- start:159 stop:368 length:210 start_codon:yes stop_codon:yes gene_type:complete